MTIDETLRQNTSQGVPLLSLRALVTAGPDAGAQATVQADALQIGTAASNDLVLTDPTVSRCHLELRRRGSAIAVLDRDTTNGTIVGGATLRGEHVVVLPGAELKLGNTRVRVEDGEIVIVDAPRTFGAVRAQSSAMRRIMDRAAQLAKSDAAILLQGESGTGKELFARAIHEASPRAEGPFVTVDCGALTSSLFASELFGHERGAFTGADRQHVGALERAHRGTLFLDEIGELSPEIQAALLGALERGSFLRVGGVDTISVDVRILSATHRDIRPAVNRDAFRLDLFYRIAVVVLELPPLRERPDDIPALVAAFLDDEGAAERFAELFPDPVMLGLQEQRWPGNVRELRNFVIGSLALGELPPLPGSSATDDSDDALLTLPYREARRRVSDRFERRYLQALLERSEFNFRGAAREAKMNRSYLMELLRKHGFR